MAETKGAKTIKFGDIGIEVVDPRNVQPVSADVFTEMWVLNGVVHVGLGSLIRDGDTPAVAQVVSRFRINLATAGDIVAAFSDMIAREMPGKEKVN